ncbi:hypothetical protein HDU83_004290 [Entophlyctis luteolus]|nr:hypothetical protein HDU83_004290 [Entophlyctis luteolus]KAJ3380603.1 hypothetical protein HDU84_005727 [Entophlyctis sp. JEL0112]
MPLAQGREFLVSALSDGTITEKGVELRPIKDSSFTGTNKGDVSGEMEVETESRHRKEQSVEEAASDFSGAKSEAGNEDENEFDESGVTAQDLIKNEAKARLKGVREEDLVWLQGDDEEFEAELRARHAAVMRENRRRKGDAAQMRKRRRNERRRAKAAREEALKAKLRAHRAGQQRQ